MNLEHSWALEKLTYVNNSLIDVENHRALWNVLQISLLSYLFQIMYK